MKTIIDKSECKPLSDNIEGKLVVIKPDFFKPEFREAKYQNFGCGVWITLILLPKLTL